MKNVTIPELIIEATHKALEFKGIYEMNLYSKNNSSFLRVFFENSRGYRYAISYELERRGSQLNVLIDEVDDIEEEWYRDSKDYSQKELQDIIDRWNI